jgi:spermidine synthase
MTGQVALLRELTVASFGVELMFLAGTAFWMAAGAAGAVARVKRARTAPATGVGFLILAMVLLPEVAFLRGARTLFGGVPGAYLPLGQELATAAIGLMPAGAILGWLFRAGAEELSNKEGSLAAAYAWESLGGVVGSIAATVSLWMGVSNLALVAASCAASALVAGRRRELRNGAIALSAGFAVLLPFVPALDRLMASWNHAHLAQVTDTPYGRLSIVESQGQIVVFENDALTYDTEGTEPESLVHAAALEAREHPSVLLLEGMAFGLVREILKHRPSRVVGIEMNEALYRALWRRLPAAERSALSAREVEPRFEDPRAFLRKTGERFDLILVGAPEPSSGETNRFYTEEFFRRCSAHLAPGGVLAVRLPSSENYWTANQLLRNAAVHSALRAVFQDVLVLPGATDVMLASASRLERNAEVLEARYRERGIENREVTPDFLRYELTNDRAKAIGEQFARSRASANSDTRPICYELTALAWIGRMTGGSQKARLPGRWSAIGALVVIAAVVLFAAAYPRARRIVLVGGASFVGMVIEAVVLLRYQAEAGALYRDIGLLLTSFMAGLVAGAGLYDRARIRRRSARVLWTSLSLAGLVLLGLGFALSSRFEEAGGILPSSAFLFSTGAMVAAVFAAACESDGVTSDLGALYGADLVGGCAGSLMAVGLLVLVLGMDGTALGAAGLAAVLLALVG